MASAHPAAAAAAASLSDCCSTSSCQQQQQPQHHHQQVSFRSSRARATISSFLGSRIDRSLCSRPFHGHKSSSAFRVSTVSEVVVDGASNAAAVAATKLEVNSAVEEVVAPRKPHLASQEATVSALMADVANLIKLVDSRDIVELELKHLDYELLIRKKEALAPPPAALQPFPPPQVIAQTSFPAYTPSPPPVQVAATSSSPTTASSPVPAAPARELPPMLSPMAGTFYRSPAPGEPVFVKVGDKVQKGQVICIVEAMKLMNEIEADQTGTIVEIIAEDGKLVSVDSPLFAIKP